MKTQRAIGIDVSMHYVRAIQMVRDDDRFYIEKVYHAPTRRSTDSQQERIDTLLAQEHFDLQNPVGLALPHHVVFFRDLRINNEDLKRLQQGDTSLLQKHIPMPVAEMLTQIYNQKQLDQDDTLVLTVTTTRQALQERLELVRHESLRPELLDTELSAILTALEVNHPESQTEDCVVAYLDDTHLGLVIVNHGHPLLVRNTPLHWNPKTTTPDQALSIANSFAQEISITWQKAMGQELNQQTLLYLCIGGDMTDSLVQRLEQFCPCTLVHVNSYRHVTMAPGQAQPKDIILAQGLALRILTTSDRPGINFLAKQKEHGGGAVDLRKQAYTLGGLAAAIVLIWIVGLFIQLAVLESRYQSTKADLNQTFRDLVPHERCINPLAQLKQKIEQIRQDQQQWQRLTGGSQKPLWIMHQLSTTKPAQGDLVVEDLFISTDTVRVTGSCHDFEPVYQWQKELENVQGLGRIQIDPHRENTDAAVQFTLQIDLTAEAT